MEHLYSSVCRVERLQLTVQDGMPSMLWSQATDPDPLLNDMLERLHCRLDLTFVRPGKDQPPAINAGRAPDRIGVAFWNAWAPVKAGDRIVTIPNDEGTMPVEGTFEIRVIPDKALDYATAHHVEVQILETNQALEGRFPDDDE